MLAAPPPDEVEVCDDDVAAGADELEELEPQAATPSAVSTSRSAGSRRMYRVADAVIVCSCVGCPGFKCLAMPQTPSESALFPHASVFAAGKESRRSASCQVENRTSGRSREASFGDSSEARDSYGEGVKGLGASWYLLAPSGRKADNS